MPANQKEKLGIHRNQASRRRFGKTLGTVIGLLVSERSGPGYLSQRFSWWFYLPRKEGYWKDRKFYAIDIIQQDISEIVEKFMQLLCRDIVKTGEAFKNFKFIHEQLDQQKRINKTLPKARNKLITDGDARLHNSLAETTESLCGFRSGNEDII